MKNKIDKSTERKVGAVLNYVQMGISILIGILYTPLMIRVLGKNEYGLYGTVNSFIGLLGLLNMGFGNSYVKFYSKYKANNEQDKINSFNGLFTIVFAVIGIVSLVIGLFFSFNLEFVFKDGLKSDEFSKARIMMILLSFSTAVNFIMTIFGTYISVIQKFIFAKTVSFITTIITLGLNLFVLFSGFGSIGLVVVAVSVNIINHLVYLFFAIKKYGLRFDFAHIEKGLFRQVFGFSALIAINLIVDKINSGIDSVLLGRFRGTADVAVYTVGASINNYFTTFSTSISGVFVPRVHEIVNSYVQDSKEQRKALTEFFVKVARVQYLLLALIASGVVFFGKPFIRFWAGEGYDDAYIIALVMLIPSIIPLTQNVGIEIQRAMNRHHYRSYLYGLTALLNLVSSYFMCQIWGGIGSAIGTGGACIIATIILMNIVYNKKININVIDYWKAIGRMTLGMIVPFICGTLIMIFVDINSIIRLLLFIFIYVIIYCLFVYKFSMNNYEKNLISGVVKKLLSKTKLLKGQNG